jgi:hypothetical protein
LLAPAAEAIAGGHLVIVPGGALGGLPIELLAELGEGGDRFLVERHRVRYAPSLTALHFVDHWDQGRLRHERTLWALGDPAYDADGAQTELAKLDRGTRGSALRRLPYSGVEVARLRAVMGSADSDV